MKIDAHADRVLNHFLRNSSFSSPVTVYAGLFTAVTVFESGTVTETTYTGYARQAVTFAAPGAGVNGREVSNSGAVTFGTKSDTGTVNLIAFGIYDALTAGNLFYIGFLDSQNPIIALTATDAVTSDFLDAPAHGLAEDQRCRLLTVPGTGTIPAPFAVDTDYYVTNPGTDDFQLDTTTGGGGAAITGLGAALVCPYDILAISQNDAPQFAIGDLIVVED